MGDIQNDEEVGFKIVSTEDIDDIDIDEVIRRVRAQVGENLVYLRYARLPVHIVCILNMASQSGYRRY